MQAGTDSGQAREDGLLAHCLAFCAALTAHHQGEDAGLFGEVLDGQVRDTGWTADVLEFRS